MLFMFQTKISPEACWKAPDQSRWGPSTLHYEGFLAAGRILSALAASTSAQFARRHATSLKCRKTVLHEKRGMSWGVQTIGWIGLVLESLATNEDMNIINEDLWYVLNCIDMCPTVFSFGLKPICQTSQKMFAYIYKHIYIHSYVHIYDITYVIYI